MKFIDLFNNILNEEKESRNKYLNNVLSLQTRNIFEKYFKLSFFLKNEINKQDEFHWKSEMFSGLLSALTPSKEIVQAQIIENIFVRNFDGDFLKSKKSFISKI